MMSDEPRNPPDAAADEPEGLLLAEPCDAGHPGLRPAVFLVERWLEARRAEPDRLPSRDLFAPERLGNLIGRISLLEPVDGGRDFRYRIHAGIAADVAGLDLNGKHVSDLPYDAYREAVLGQYRSALASGDLRFDRIRLNWFGTIYDYVRVTMPVADPSSRMPLILSVIMHTDPRRPRYVSRFRPAVIDAASEDGADG